MSVAVYVELRYLASPWQGHARTHTHTHTQRNTHSISVSESLPNYDLL